MKKNSLFLLVLTLLVFSHTSQAQTLRYKHFIRSFTPFQMDSILHKQGAPSGLFNYSYSVDAYKLVYNTVSWDSTPTIASGLLLVPKVLACKAPLLSYQHGTVYKKNEVPSRLSTEFVIGLISSGTNGYVSVLPDYLGLGDGPGLHPYVHAHSEATAVVDMLRAARNAGDSIGYELNDQLFLMGYSQGGHATMAAHRLIQEQLANEFIVTASAPMSGPYDISGEQTNVLIQDSVYPNPSYLSYVLFGYNQVYHLFNSPSDILKHPYDSILPPLFNGTKNGGQIDAVSPAIPNQIIIDSVLNAFKNDPNHPLRIALRDNDVYDWKPNCPVKMHFCMADKYVTYKNALVAFAKMQQNGALYIDTLDVNPGLDHVPCAEPSLLNGKNFMDLFKYRNLVDSFGVVNASSATASDGSVHAYGKYGQAPYKFAWATGDSTAVLSNLGTGKYYVTVTDKNGCSYADSVTISIASDIHAIFESSFTIYPNPANTYIQIRTSNGMTQGYDLIFADMKGSIISHENNIVKEAYWIDTSELPSGIYTLLIRNKEQSYVKKIIVAR